MKAIICVVLALTLLALKPPQTLAADIPTLVVERHPVATEREAETIATLALSSRILSITRTSRNGQEVSLITTVVEKDFSSQEIGENLKIMLVSLQDALAYVPREIREYRVDSFEVHLNLNATAGVSFIGSAEIGGEAGIKVVMKRQ